MKPIKGGLTKVTHVNVPKTDAYTDKISSTPKPYCDEDLSGAATNVIPGTSMRDLVKARPSQSRNVEPSRPIPRKSAKRSADGKFAGV